jgi:hypothetical protein
MTIELHPGDVVWDIGANRGFYSKFFAEKTGLTVELSLLSRRRIHSPNCAARQPSFRGCGVNRWRVSGITPNGIKIDVEGLEEEVLAGMEGLPAEPIARCFRGGAFSEARGTRSRRSPTAH